MFGHQNDQDDNQQVGIQKADLPAADNSLNDASTATVVDPPGAVATDWPAPTVNHGKMLPPTQPPAGYVDNHMVKPEMEKPAAPELSAPPVPTTPATPATPTTASESGDLLEIKQNALQQLSPLVSHLDQTPEEKFRTLMMMIQASDNQSLINSAYEAANAIPDEKVKAQALLDVINEINYFTHPKEA